MLCLLLCSGRSRQIQFMNLSYCLLWREARVPPPPPHPTLSVPAYCQTSYPDRRQDVRRQKASGMLPRPQRSGTRLPCSHSQITHAILTHLLPQRHLHWGCCDWIILQLTRETLLFPFDPLCFLNWSLSGQKIQSQI